MEGAKHGLVKEPPPWSACLLSGTSVSYLRAAPRAGRGRSTPTSRIRLRPSALDRHPVPLRGVEASNRSRVHASSPISLHHRYVEPVLGTVGGPCFTTSSRSKGSTRTVRTPSPVWGCLCYRVEALRRTRCQTSERAAPGQRPLYQPQPQGREEIVHLSSPSANSHCRGGRGKVFFNSWRPRQNYQSYGCC